MKITRAGGRAWKGRFDIAGFAMLVRLLAKIRVFNRRVRVTRVTEIVRV